MLCATYYNGIDRIYQGRLQSSWFIILWCGEVPHDFTQIFFKLTYLVLELSFFDNMMTSSNWNIFRVTGHLCGEFTSHWWTFMLAFKPPPLVVMFPWALVCFYFFPGFRLLETILKTAYRILMMSWDMPEMLQKNVWLNFGNASR